MVGECILAVYDVISSRNVFWAVMVVGVTKLESQVHGCHGRGCFIIGYCYPRRSWSYHDRIYYIYILLHHGTTDDARDWGFSSFATPTVLP